MGGETVFRYVKDAPLESLPAEVKSLEERKGLMNALDALQLAVRGVGPDAASHRAETEKVIADLVAKHGPTTAKPYLAHGNPRRFKVHVAATDGTETPPQY